MTARRFALGTFSNGDGAPFAGLVLDQRVLDLSGRLGSAVSLRALLDDWERSMASLQAIADADGGEPLDHALDALRPLPPVTPPGQIFQAAANYRRHVLELMDGAERRADSSDGLSERDRLRAREQFLARTRTGAPFVFLGSAHAMVGALDDVVLPVSSAQHDWELELTAVIGRPLRLASAEQALAAVAGYTICNDITTRDALIRPDARALGLDWLAGKNSPTFLPTGPLLVPAAHVGDPSLLQITLRVNGELMQDASTSEMLFDVPRLIAYISKTAELRPGRPGAHRLTGGQRCEPRRVPRAGG